MVGAEAIFHHSRSMYFILHLLVEFKVKAHFRFKEIQDIQIRIAYSSHFHHFNDDQ